MLFWGGNRSHPTLRLHPRGGMWLSTAPGGQARGRFGSCEGVSLHVAGSQRSMLKVVWPMGLCCSLEQIVRVSGVFPTRWQGKVSKS